LNVFDTDIDLYRFIYFGDEFEPIN